MEKYEPLNLIGKGNFGCITKIRRKVDNKILVWKEIDYSIMKERDKFHIISEINILRELHHPNVVKYYEHIIDKSSYKIYIIMEYCQNGDLSRVIKSQKKMKEYLKEEIIWKIFIQVCLALYACHTNKPKKILHRDLKPSNVFLDEFNNIKLGDFGLSKMVANDTNFVYSNVGTPYYMSPEQIDECGYDEKCDIWALGCFLFELCSLRPPFEAKNHLSLAMKIKSGKYSELPSCYSEEMKSMVKCLLNLSPNNRPCIEEIIHMPSVSMRIKERKIKEHYIRIKQIEANLNEREKALEQKERILNEREILINKREKAIEQREKNLEKKMKRMFDNNDNRPYTTNVTRYNEEMYNDDIQTRYTKNYNTTRKKIRNSFIPLNMTEDYYGKTTNGNDVCFPSNQKRISDLENESSNESHNKISYNDNKYNFESHEYSNENNIINDMHLHKNSDSLNCLENQLFQGKNDNYLNQYSNQEYLRTHDHINHISANYEDIVKNNMYSLTTNITQSNIRDSANSNYYMDNYKSNGNFSYKMNQIRNYTRKNSMQTIPKTDLHRNYSTNQLRRGDKKTFVYNQQVKPVIINRTNETFNNCSTNSNSNGNNVLKKINSFKNFRSAHKQASI